MNLRLPLVDPSHYISRFAALLEFGEETHQVAMDAVRLVQRFDRDWMTRGRRPAGICGACLLLAARMNNFRRSVAEIVQVVKIADTTLKKRLEEFRSTPSGQLTLADFRNVWLEEEMDPPAFTKGKEKEEKEKEKEKTRTEGEGQDEDEDEGEDVSKGKLKDNKGKGKEKQKGSVRKKKRKRGEEDEEEVGTEAIERVAEQIEKQDSGLPLDPSLLNEGILRGTTQSLPLFLPDDTEDVRPSHIEASPSDGKYSQQSGIIDEISFDKAFVMPPSPESPLDETVTAAVAEEVSDFLQNAQGAVLRDALDEAEQRRIAHYQGDEELLGLDEEELDRFILTDEEVKVKERVWVEMNRDYLEALAGKGSFLEMFPYSALAERIVTAKSEQQETGTKDKKSRKVRILSWAEYFFVIHVTFSQLSAAETKDE